VCIVINCYSLQASKVGVDGC